MIAYFVATLCAYQFVRRSLTPLYGLLAAMVMLAPVRSISIPMRHVPMHLCSLF